jgi:hypothetical protein
MGDMCSISPIARWICDLTSEHEVTARKYEILVSHERAEGKKLDELGRPNKRSDVAENSPSSMAELDLFGPAAAWSYRNAAITTM